MSTSPVSRVRAWWRSESRWKPLQCSQKIKRRVWCRAGELPIVILLWLLQLKVIKRTILTYQTSLSFKRWIRAARHSMKKVRRGRSWGRSQFLSPARQLRLSSIQNCKNLSIQSKSWREKLGDLPSIWDSRLKAITFNLRSSGGRRALLSPQTA